ncbi:hypothetical protein JNB62_05505 [Microbacterium jejuense]|uniref:Uncharacterized protein n=1 Tax=Microbacterium jejuense TaxID=1263637 RepID=A0ABS7HLM9_9MICO|nr:hypothetical protein [Microbacterium jejuense]MBW9093132.1 hypothetical protein [Microbacterium jejuense]
MSIEASIVVTLAEVEVDDEYQVVLRTRKKLTQLTPDEAVRLAAELVDAAKESESSLHVDLARSIVRAHGFDVAPICRECSEGKHTACTGIALVDRDDVEEHACGCSRADHQTDVMPKDRW